MNLPLSNYNKAKKYRESAIVFKHAIKDIFQIALGVFCAAFGLEGFLIPNHFIDGGATGISLLGATLSQLPFYFILLLVNVPFIVLGYFTIGKQFALKTALTILLLATVLIIFDFPVVTTDKLLVAVFGGVFLGAGIGLSVRAGAVLDGTEVLAIYLSRRFGMTIGDIIIVVNILIFGTAAITLSLEIALYSTITYFSASKMLDFIIEGIDEYIGVTIVSSHCEQIRSMLIDKMGRGVTVYSGKRGYGKRGETTEVDIIYTVITRLEVNKLNTEIEKIAPSAFVVMSSVKDTKGGMIKKKAFKE